MQLPALLAVLGDGRFHSGSDLARYFAVSRAAVWKALSRLRALGLPLDAVRGRGYRIPHGYEPLRADAVRAALSPAAQRCLAGLDVMLEVDSTNRLLRERVAHGAAGAGSALLAEAQRGGRGRAGRPWLSPMTGNLYLSIAWRYEHPPSAIGALSLALGVAVAQALAEAGVPDVQLKWPNDLVWRDQKLGGLLLEATAEAAGPCAVVAGLGLNLRLPAAARAGIDQPCTDLASLAPGVAADRNRLAAGVVEAMLLTLAGFGQQGFTPYAAEWARRDAVRGRAVELRGPGGVTRGEACGVDPDGALRVRVDGRVCSFASGDVSVRAA